MRDIEALSLFEIKDERVSSVLNRMAQAVLEGRARESLTELFGIRPANKQNIPGVVELGKGVYFHSGKNLMELLGFGNNFSIILAVGGRESAEELVHKLLNKNPYKRAFGIKESEQVDSLDFLGVYGERFYHV